MYQYNFPVRNDFFNLNHMVGLELELTSKTFDTAEKKDEKSLSLSTLRKLISEIGPQLNYIEMVSNYGDPSAYSSLLEAVDLVQSLSSAYLKISTHGFCQSQELWEKLGSRLSEKRGCIVFKIDGMKDTLAIARPELNWETVIANATHFIKAGGNAVWSWFPYQHSDHQIDDAVVLAKELGFAAIILNKSPRYAPIKNSNGVEIKHSKTLFHTRFERHELAKKAGMVATKFPIGCRAKRKYTFYVDFNGLVHPCSRLKGSEAGSDFGQIIESYGREWFDLNVKSIREIFDNPWFTRDMKYSIKILPNCYKNCELFSKVTPKENQIVHAFKPYEDREPSEGTYTWDLPYDDSPEPWEPQRIDSYNQVQTERGIHD